MRTRKPSRKVRAAYRMVLKVSFWSISGPSLAIFRISFEWPNGRALHLFLLRQLGPKPVEQFQCYMNGAKAWGPALGLGFWDGLKKSLQSRLSPLVLLHVLPYTRIILYAC